MHFLDESHLFLFLVQLGIIILLTRSLGEIFRRFNQTVLTAELLVGILLGPTILGRFFPQVFEILFPRDIIQQNMLETVAWIGVLFLLLDTGLEMNFSSAWKQKNNALIIATSDIIIPMVIAFIPCYFIPDSFLINPDKRIEFSLFMSVVMTISAMPVASKVMHDLKLLKTDLGFLTMSALAINDIIGWGLFTIILGIFAQNIFNFGNVLIVLLSTVGFTVVALTFGRYFSDKAIDFFHKNSFPEPSTSFAFACFMGIISGAITQKIGIHALFGFFVAGVIVGEAKKLREETRTTISQMVHALFVPVFFVNIGLKLDFISNFNIFLVLTVTLVGIIGRFFGAWIGVYISKVPSINRNLIAIAHTPGGMMEIVVALIALEMKLITPEVFVAIVFGAVVSSIIMGPWMSLELMRRRKIKLSDFIDFKEGIVILEGFDKNETIRKLAEKASQIEKSISADELFRYIIEREEAFSTGIGNRIAIPHIRTDSINSPLLLFGYSRNGVDWNSPDGQPVNFVFFLISPTTTNDLHIEILSRIARIMQNKENYEKISCSTDPMEISRNLKIIFEAVN
ncbi:MAG: cation:proton antiporter [Brevinematia bacterium]